MDSMPIHPLPGLLSCCYSNKPLVALCFYDNVLMLPLVNCFSVLMFTAVVFCLSLKSWTAIFIFNTIREANTSRQVSLCSESLTCKTTLVI